jgi:glycosyltransferase involved in cell wall biosynthesis
MDRATLHLTNAYHPQSGGVRTMYEALLAQAELEGRRMSLVVPAERDGCEQIGRVTRIHYVRAPRAPAFDRRYRTILPHRFLAPRRGRLWSILESERPDVVEVCDKYSLCYFAGLIRRSRRVSTEGPTLIGLSCERLDDNLRAHIGAHPAMEAAARAFLGRVYIGMFDAHIANSSYTADELRAAMRVPHVRPVYVGMMGVHLRDPIAPDVRMRLRRDVRAWLGLQPCSQLVLYAGRLSPEKEVGALATVAARVARLDAVHLIVAGDGPLKDVLHTACLEAAPHAAHFVGHLPAARLADLLAASDVFVHPNPREPFGIGPLEALAAGVPLVAPRAGGILSYADESNTWLSGCSAAELADGVERALTRRDEAERRARAGRATAERFAWPTAASSLLQRYDTIHQARKASGLSLSARAVTANV